MYGVMFSCHSSCKLCLIGRSLASLAYVLLFLASVYLSRLSLSLVFTLDSVLDDLFDSTTVLICGIENVNICAVLLACFCLVMLGVF